jgi:hypothetical protein
MLEAVDRQLRSVLQGQENSSPKKRTPRYTSRHRAIARREDAHSCHRFYRYQSDSCGEGAAGLKRVCELRAQPQVQLPVRVTPVGPDASRP